MWHLRFPKIQYIDIYSSLKYCIRYYGSLAFVSREPLYAVPHPIYLGNRIHHTRRHSVIIIAIKIDYLVYQLVIYQFADSLYRIIIFNYFYCTYSEFHNSQVFCVGGGREVMAKVQHSDYMCNEATFHNAKTLLENCILSFNGINYFRKL